MPSWSPRQRTFDQTVFVISLLFFFALGNVVAAVFQVEARGNDTAYEALDRLAPSHRLNVSEYLRLEARQGLLPDWICARFRQSCRCLDPAGRPEHVCGFDYTAGNGLGSGTSIGTALWIQTEAARPGGWSAIQRDKARVSA